MKYFKDENNIIYAFEDDGSQDELIKKSMTSLTEDEALSIVNPSPTNEELVEAAENNKTSLISYATQSIVVWQTKLLLGRKLTEGEVVELDKWLDYIEELESVNTSSTPDINWPIMP